MWLAWCAIFLWMGIGLSIVSFINRGDLDARFNEQFKDGQNDIDRGMVGDSFRKNPEEAVLILILFALLWPVMIAMLWREIKDERDATDR